MNYAHDDGPDINSVHDVGNALPATKDICVGSKTRPTLVPAKGVTPILFNCESDSNDIDESDRQDEKHDEPRISKFRGIKIDVSEESENIDDSIRCNRESDSNDIDESDSHPSKQDEPMVSICLGITTAVESFSHQWVTAGPEKFEARGGRYICSIQIDIKRS
jgi:hypothetical protein